MVYDGNEVDFACMENNEIVEYRSCSVLFGLKPSPHLLSVVLRKHIQSYYSEDYHLVIIEKFLSSLHGDDLLTIVGSDEEVFKFYDSVKSCLGAANFNLRKCSSNSKNSGKWCVFEIS